MARQDSPRDSDDPLAEVQTATRALNDAINSLTNTQNAPQGNYMEPAAQALQMNQAIASLNGQAQPLDALATPDLQPRPLLAAGNP